MTDAVTKTHFLILPSYHHRRNRTGSGQVKMVLRKDQLEASLHEEKELIKDGRLKEDNPLDFSETFAKLCEACRRGDLKVCQEMITEGANINARDSFDYTPLILASLCGHYEVVQLLLESGALCERDTFQGERCLYNALNDRIRNLLLQYDYSKSTDPLQPLASHITSLLTRDHPQTSDIIVVTTDQSFHLHKFVLSARSPYFRKKLSTSPEITSWKLPLTIPPQAFEISIRYIYFGEVPNDIGGGPGTGYTELEVLEGIDKLSRQLEIRALWEGILESGDRRLARQRRTEEVDRGRDQLDAWYRDNVLRHKINADSSRADQVRWDRANGIFADVLLRADQGAEDCDDVLSGTQTPPMRNTLGPLNGIPVGPTSHSSRSPSRTRTVRKSTLIPAHRAMLIRSEFFLTMFSSSFREAQTTDHLQIVPIDCSPEVLEVVLTFLYTERADFPLDIAVDVLFAADLLLIEKLKVKAAVVISTLGNGTMPPTSTQQGIDGTETEEQGEPVDIYDVIRAGWLTRVPRLEEFGARYFAYRLENHIDEEEFAELIKESAARIKGRQETDSIELLDDIRYYLSERFRLRFEDSGIDDLMDDNVDSSLLPTNHTDTTIHASHVPEDEAIDLTDKSQTPTSTSTSTSTPPARTSGEREEEPLHPVPATDAVVRTLDGEIAGDEFAADAMNYQILLGKIEGLLERLRLEA